MSTFSFNQNLRSAESKNPKKSVSQFRVFLSNKGLEILFVLRIFFSVSSWINPIICQALISLSLLSGWSLLLAAQGVQIVWVNTGGEGEFFSLSPNALSVTCIGKSEGKEEEASFTGGSRGPSFMGDLVIIFDLGALANKNSGTKVSLTTSSAAAQTPLCLQGLWTPS